MQRLHWNLGLCLCLGAPSALADGPATSSPGTSSPAPSPPDRPEESVTVTRDRFEDDEAVPAQRRSGFSFGIAGGLTLGNVHGYPNDVSKIGLPEFEVNTGLGVNTGGALWLGGALTDWLNVGIGTLGGSINGNGLSSSGGGIQIRIEAFPLFYRGGAWRDVGFLFTAGTGGYEVERGDETVAEGAGTSAVGGGAFFEAWRLWRFATGPQLEYSHQFSRSLSAHLLLIGWRMAFYGGP